jgi:hypothetical protein
MGTKFMNKHSFLEAHYFDKDQATIVWLIDKDTLNIQNRIYLISAASLPQSKQTLI